MGRQESALGEGVNCSFWMTGVLDTAEGGIFGLHSESEPCLAILGSLISPLERWDVGGLR